MRSKIIKKLILFIFCTLFGISSFAQVIQKDSVKIEYQKMYAYCLDGNISPALHILEQYNSKNLNAKDSVFKDAFEKRFSYNEDKSDYLESKKSSVTELLKIYRDYWRNSLLDNSKSYDSLLIHNLSGFLQVKFNLTVKNQERLQDDTLDMYLKKYVTSFGYHTTGFGRTGKYLDLLIWKTQKDTSYNFSIYKEKINTPVIFMDDFITVGWEEYATLGRAYPGGWATNNALYCVRSAYDIHSENFLISYLCHEGRHYSDYKLFPKLTSADLEHRAKLTELSLLKNDLYKTINFFINNANSESGNGHSVANYRVVKDLSKILFRNEFERDINMWKKLKVEKINKTAYKVLAMNTNALKKHSTVIENK